MVRQPRIQMASSCEVLPAVVQQMLAPGFYPHPTDGSITLLQTHISYVLLTGTYAYKLKKPVKLEFLDFRTLDDRRHFLLEEIRLNSRGAPGIYLGVLPISASSTGFHLDDPAAPVEYALKMQQFPQDALFTRLLKQGKVDDRLIDSLARGIAEYHQNSPTDEIISQFGTPERIRGVLNENYRQTERYLGDPQTVEQFEQTRRFTDRFCSSRSSLLQHRVAHGFIRECHGDLHLGNICLWGDRVLFFDCIEFNELFRYIDVMQDAAFAIMDLEASGRGDLAWLLLNIYVERTGDWEGLQVLPLYLTRHAYVRAKVNSLLLEEADVSELAKHEALESARNYYRQAWQYAQARRGRLIVVCGPPGAGKSTVAQYLGKHLRAVYVRSDAVRKHLAGIALDQRGEPAIYNQATTAKTYERLLQLGLLLARDGFTVILDGKYDLRANRCTVIESARAAQIPLQFVFCAAPLQVRRERLLKRRGDISDATAELLDRQEIQFEEFAECELPLVINLPTMGNTHLPQELPPEAHTGPSYGKTFEDLVCSLRTG